MTLFIVFLRHITLDSQRESLVMWPWGNKGRTTEDPAAAADDDDMK